MTGNVLYGIDIERQITTSPAWFHLSVEHFKSNRLPFQNTEEKMTNYLPLLSLSNPTQRILVYMMHLAAIRKSTGGD